MYQLPLQKQEVWFLEMFFDLTENIFLVVMPRTLQKNNAVLALSVCQYFDQNVLKPLNKRSPWRTSETTWPFISKVWWANLNNSCCLSMWVLLYCTHHLYDCYVSVAVILLTRTLDQESLGKYKLHHSFWWMQTFEREPNLLWKS